MRSHDTSELSGTREYPSSIWRNRNFLRLISGGLVTNVGDSLYSVAALWLVYQLSGSNFLTGVASSLLLLPFLLQIVSGPLVDRFPLKPIMVWTQFTQGIAVLVVPVAAYTGHMSVGLILATIFVLSLISQMVSPAQSALLPRIVAEHQLAKSNSALATVTLGLDMVFEALGGVLIALVGVTTLFVLDSATFLVAGLLFLGLAIPSAGGRNEQPDEKEETDEESRERVETSEAPGETVGDHEAVDSSGYLDEMRAGIEMLRGTVFVHMIFTAAVFNFAVGVTLAILPAFGALRGGPAVYGLLLGALGTGRLIGSASASYLDGLPYGRMKVITNLSSALLWVGSVYSPSVAGAIALFGIAWISSGIDGVMVSTLNQKVIPSDFLGRVSAIKGTASTATLPIGSLLGGLIGDLIGPTTTMGLAAFGFGFAGLYFVVRPSLRRLPAVEDATLEDFDVRDPTEPTG